MRQATISARRGEAIDPEIPKSDLDELTLERARRGDRRARGRVVERYQRLVASTVARMLVSRPDLVEDVAQDAFVKILGGLRRFDPSGPARLSTWIATIAIRAAIDHLRRADRDRRVVRLAAEPPAAGSSPEHRAGARALGRRVESAMAGLTAEQRAALVLRAYHDLDYEEIAEALGCSRASVKSRLNRAREALRRAVAEEDADVDR